MQGIERYRLAVGSKAHELISKGDKAQKAAASPEEREKIRKRKRTSVYDSKSSSFQKIR